MRPFSMKTIMVVNVNKAVSVKRYFTVLLITCLFKQKPAKHYLDRAREDTEKL